MGPLAGIQHVNRDPTDREHSEKGQGKVKVGRMTRSQENGVGSGRRPGGDVPSGNGGNVTTEMSGDGLRSTGGRFIATIT